VHSAGVSPFFRCFVLVVYGRIYVFSFLVLIFFTGLRVHRAVSSLFDLKSRIVWDLFVVFGKLANICTVCNYRKVQNKGLIFWEMII
jgi:hypothetical protein